MVEILEVKPTKALLDEIMAIEGSRDHLCENLDKAETVEKYCAPFLESQAGRECVERTKTDSPLKILDIGFGRGETSLYLASQGHLVYSVEPSPLNCEILEKAAQKYGFGNRIKVVQAPAEHFDQVKENDFDLCLFNSSLHHCDDPLLALKICHSKLKKSGRVIAINEPILKFYQSKQWFYKTLEEDPISLGHYGGNEHIYSYHEYIKLFKDSGFRIKTHFHVRHHFPRAVIKENITRKVNDQFVFSDEKLWLKFTILLGIKALITNRLTKWFVILLGKKLSLFAFSFEATKN